METPQKEPVAMKRSKGVVAVDEVGELASLVQESIVHAQQKLAAPGTAAVLHRNAPRLRQHANCPRLLHHRPSSSPYSA